MTMRNSPVRFLRWIFVALAVIASARCSNPLNGEGGLSVPKDPGTLVVRVRDQAAAPVQNVHVSVEMPNDVGSFFMVGASTQANGNMTFYYVPAGRRRVEVTLPPGVYSVLPTPGGDPFPNAKPASVTVVEDEYASVEIDYDTGLR